MRDALGDLASIAFKDVIREPVVQEADNARGIPALIADLGIRGIWQPQLKHFLTFGCPVIHKAYSRSSATSS